MSTVENAEKQELKRLVKQAYPDLDWLMVEAAVDLYLAHPNCEDISSLLNDVPQDYFLKSTAEEQRVSIVDVTDDGCPSSPAKPGEGVVQRAQDQGD